MQSFKQSFPNRTRGALAEHRQLLDMIKHSTSAKEISYEELCRQAEAQPDDTKDDSILLDWFGDGYIVTYGISPSKPDWDFLDTWYDDEVQALYNMNPNNPLLPSLHAYMQSRNIS